MAKCIESLQRSEVLKMKKDEADRINQDTEIEKAWVAMYNS